MCLINPVSCCWLQVTFHLGKSGQYFSNVPTIIYATVVPALKRDLKVLKHVRHPLRFYSRKSLKNMFYVHPRAEVLREDPIKVSALSGEHRFKVPVPASYETETGRRFEKAVCLKPRMKAMQDFG